MLTIVLLITSINLLLALVSLIQNSNIINSLETIINGDDIKTEATFENDQDDLELRLKQFQKMKFSKIFLDNQK